jgi:hypothetical protein
MKSKKTIKKTSKPKAVSAKKTVAKTAPKFSKSSVKKTAKKVDKKALKNKKPIKIKKNIKEIPVKNHKDKPVAGIKLKPLSKEVKVFEGKKAKVIKEDMGDGKKVSHVIEDVSNIKPVRINVKKNNPKDKAKERILARLREKAEQAAHLQRTYLPTKKKKYTLEYIIKSSSFILFEFISTSSGLALWFAEEVDDHLDIFTFTWEGVAQKAELVEFEDLSYVKFRWIDNPYDEYFEFRITSTEITGDTVLLITDFAEANEMKDVQLLWDNQVKALMMRLGLGN